MNVEIQRLIENVIKDRNPSVHENDLVKALRGLDIEDIVKYINHLVESESPISMSVANRVLKSDKHSIGFIAEHLAATDAQSIKYWLQLSFSKIGSLKTIELIRRLHTTDNRLLEKAAYWLPMLIPDSDIKASLALNDLINRNR